MPGNTTFIVHGVPVIRHVDNDRFLVPECIDDMIDNVIIIVKSIVVLSHDLLKVLRHIQPDIFVGEFVESIRIAIIIKTMPPHQMKNIKITISRVLFPRLFQDRE